MTQYAGQRARRAQQRKRGPQSRKHAKPWAWVFTTTDRVCGKCSAGLPTGAKGAERGESIVCTRCAVASRLTIYTSPEYMAEKRRRKGTPAVRAVEKKKAPPKTPKARQPRATADQRYEYNLLRKMLPQSPPLPKTHREAERAIGRMRDILAGDEQRAA